MSTKLEVAKGSPRVFTKTTNDVLLINDTADFFEIIDTMDIKRYHIHISLLGRESKGWVTQDRHASQV